MKQGIKKFQSETQGARTKEGKEFGEKFIKDILDIIGIQDIRKNKSKKSYEIVVDEIKSRMTPDFIIDNVINEKNIFINKNYIILESKYKQIQGSDWEKIESNFGFHEYFYNELCNLKVKIIVVLSGYWRELQKNYPIFMKYFRAKYGEDSIFDFGESTDEIFRFCELLNIKINNDIKNKIIDCYEKYKKKP